MEDKRIELPGICLPLMGIVIIGLLLFTFITGMRDLGNNEQIDDSSIIKLQNLISLKKNKIEICKSGNENCIFLDKKLLEKTNYKTQLFYLLMKKKITNKEYDDFINNLFKQYKMRMIMNYPSLKGGVVHWRFL